MKAFKITLNGKFYDMVFYNDNSTSEEVKKSLIDHDGYPSNINVRIVRKGVM